MSLERTSQDNSEDAVYLILRDELKWRNVFRLDPALVNTIGRAPTNHVVIPDDICSRNHCEVFLGVDGWILRDLGSRNGTLIDGRRVSGDVPLEFGDQLQIGDFFLLFSQNVGELDEADRSGLDDNTETYDGNQTVSIDAVKPEILFRRHRTRYLTGLSDETDAGSRDRASQELAQLYRLALEMGSATDTSRLTEIVLDGLFNAMRVHIGAILLLPNNCPKPTPDDLWLAAHRAKSNESYEKVSNALSSLALSEQEGVLARDVKGDSELKTRASLSRIQARSVICVPVRTSNSIFGVIHLYTTHSGRTLELDDLEFTLAVADQFAIAIENLQRQESLQAGLKLARDEADTLRNQLSGECELIGTSPTMQKLRDSIGRIAPTGATVLIRGESGVGKELVARAIHFNSDRRAGPFVCMNCAALSESLLESELFGHEKGSFTGAVGRKSGKFEQAHQGTLFLDEVGEMDLSVQAKFLRVLEGHPFERVGGGSQIEVDVRVVAATNRDLEEAIAEKRFRQDLYYRLFVVEIAVPALRDHSIDIPLLATHFLQKFAVRSPTRVQGFSDDALQVLARYEWPGNIRELQNTIERAVILSRGPVIGVEDIQLSTHLTSTSRTDIEHPSRVVADRDISLETLEREHILATLDRTNWNKSLASQILGIERSTLDRKLKRYDVSRPSRSTTD
jgi:two-component system, NtrC family, response regulator HydG